jgi:hypothetical protein
MPLTDDERLELQEALMRADIANKNAGTTLKTEQSRWEPWKALSAAFGAGVAVASALIGGALWVGAHLFAMKP